MKLIPAISWKLFINVKCYLLDSSLEAVYLILLRCFVKIVELQVE